MADAREVVFTWPKGTRVQIGKHFHTGELECRCKLTSCIQQKVSLELVRRLDRLRDGTGGAIRVHSAYRCPAHNRAVGGVNGSQHTKGRAVDCSSGPLTTLEFRQKAELLFKAIGTGRNFLHLDIRDDKERRWDYA